MITGVQLQLPKLQPDTVFMGLGSKTHTDGTKVCVYIHRHIPLSLPGGFPLIIQGLKVNFVLCPTDQLCAGLLFSSESLSGIPFQCEVSVLDILLAITF